MTAITTIWMDAALLAKLRIIGNVMESQAVVKM